MASLFSTRFQAVDANGVPYAGALLYFYRAGTSTSATTYQDYAATTPHANPVVADAAGVFPAIYLNSPYALKFILKSASGVTIATVDQLDPALSTEGMTFTGDVNLDGAAIVWPPASAEFAPFNIDVGGTANPHMYIGYNTLPQAILSDPIDRGAIFGIEAHYEPTPGTYWMEMYWQYNFDSGFTGDDCLRQIMAVIDKTTNIPVVLQLGGGTQGISLNLIDGTGTDQQKIVGKQKVEILPNRMTVFGNAGSTAPAFNVQSNENSVTGIEVATGVAGYGGVLQVTSSATNEALYLKPKGNAPVVSQGDSFLIPDGSASLPSFSFENEQTLGFYRSGAGALAVSIAGANSFTYSAGSFTINAASGAYSNLYFTEAGVTKWRFYNDFTNDRLLLMDADASAGVYIDQDGTSWASASDRRLPYKATGRTFSVLDKLDLFDVLEFDRPGGSLEIGAKAQDLHKAFPGLVIEGADDDDRELDGLDDPGLWSIKADRAGFVALAGLKEAVGLLDQLKEELRQARAEIAGLKADRSQT